jgi:hypothetical protein
MRDIARNNFGNKARRSTLRNRLRGHIRLPVQL